MADLAPAPPLHGHEHGGGAPEEGLVIPRDSVVHHLPPQVKLVCLLAFMIVVVAAPTGAWGLLGLDALLLVAVVLAARLPWAHVLRRLAVEAPFVVFAVVTPFVATGPRVEVLGLSVSQMANALRTLVAGQTVSNWRAPDDQTYDVNVRLAPEARTTPQDLERVRALWK